MNAAILGYFYGIWGTLAYAAYYLSFLTGGKIVDNLRFEQGFESVQAFLQARFGELGVTCYNIVIIIRLISEVFANLLVIGLLFGMAGSNAYIFSIIAFSAATLLYSMLGGLHASMKTDVMQMSIFVFVLVILIASIFASGNFAFTDLAFKDFQFNEPGPILMLVALLQVWSYPLHDPVMMDRGFLSDRDTTRKSFYHAAWISIICIIAFGCIGVWAGSHAIEGDTMNAVLLRLLGEWPMLLFSTTLIISAMSTLDSTLSSSSKLIAVDMKLVSTKVRNGRITMFVFMLLGLLCVFFGSKDLFSAVAVSGTASMFLAPVVFFSIFGKQQNIPRWSFVVAFSVAIIGAALYFLESSGHTRWLGDAHKYTKLLFISLTILIVGCASFILGNLFNSKR
jgi:Na+/proline symporter